MPILGANNYTLLIIFGAITQKLVFQMLNNIILFKIPSVRKQRKNVIILENCLSKIDLKVISPKENVSLINQCGITLVLFHLGRGLVSSVSLALGAGSGYSFIKSRWLHSLSTRTEHLACKPCADVLGEGREGGKGRSLALMENQLKVHIWHHLCMWRASIWIFIFW